MVDPLFGLQIPLELFLNLELLPNQPLDDLICPKVVS